MMRNKLTVCLLLCIFVTAACAAPTPAATAIPTLPPTATHVPPTATLVLTPTAVPLPTWANGFQLGVEAQNIDNVVPVMVDSGITWVKFTIHLDQEEGVTERIAAAHAQGLKVLLTVTGDADKIYDADYQDDYADAVALFAEQGADAIEIWESPNVYITEKAETDPVNYVGLLAKVYLAIKSANPESLVISGAPTVTSFFRGECTPEGCDDLPWIQALVDAGAAEHVDLFGAEYNRGIVGPRETTGGAPPTNRFHGFYFTRIIEEYSAVINDARPIAFTRFGYISPEGYEGLPSGLGWSQNTTIENQAEWTADAVDVAIDSGAVKMLVIYNLDYTEWDPSANNGQAGYALIRADGTCPACDALHTLLWGSK